MICKLCLMNNLRILLINAVILDAALYLSNPFQLKEETILIKTSHDENEYQILDFIQIKFMKNQSLLEVRQKHAPRGVKATTKSAIIDKLLNVVSDTRKEFWLNLPVNNNNEPDIEEA